MGLVASVLFIYIKNDIRGETTSNYCVNDTKWIQFFNLVTNMNHEFDSINKRCQ